MIEFILELELFEEEITDPDLRLAIQFQREELEQELLRNKQQQEDEKFALELQNQVNNDSVDPLPINTDPLNSAPLQEIKALPKKNKSPVDEIKAYGDDDEEICVVCLNDERGSVFVPCAHRSCCKDCAKRIYRKKGFCPLCWMTLEGVIDCEKVSDKN